MRINKFLAECGVASRRNCDNLIKEGLVKINGKVCGLCVKGGYSIDFSWENGKVVEYELINNGNGIDKEKVFVTE